MIGQTIAHFRVVEKLGAGGMGVVYLADDLNLGRQVALKFLPPHLSTDEDASKRFVQEAQAASALNHPNVCVIHETGHTGDGQQYIAMAHYEGQTLKQRLQDGPISVGEATEIGRQIAEGLSKAHSKGIVHRDIKPGNIILTDGGRPVILDFGLAKLVGVRDLTKTGSTVGTAHYMSPEQVRGEPADARTDVWSLGVVLYEMLSSRRPFIGDYDAALVYSILNTDPPPIESEALGLMTVLEACLQKQARDRPADCGVVAELLGSSQSEGPRAIRRSRARPSSHIWSLVVVCVIVVLAFAATVVSLLSPPESPRIVVLPFSSAGLDQYDYLSSSMADEISSRLMSIEGLRMRASSSAVPLLASGASSVEIGRTLDVDYVLEASMYGDSSPSGDRLRITPRLIRVSDEEQIWADTYDRTAEDILGVTASVASRVVEQLNIAMDVAQVEAIEEVYTSDDEAYRLYLQGMALYGNLGVGFAEKVPLFEEAVQLDPDFARAHLQLAKAYGHQYWDQSVPVSEMAALRQNTVSAAARVSELQPGSALAELASGFVQLYVEQDYSAALGRFETADRIGPADVDILRVLSTTSIRVGRIEEGLEAALRGHELDPQRIDFVEMISLLHYGQGRFGEAHDWIDLAIERHPLHFRPYELKARLLVGMGQTSKARDVLSSAPRFQSDAQEAMAWIRIYAAERDFDAILKRVSEIDMPSANTGQRLGILEQEAYALHHGKRHVGEVENAWKKLLEISREAGDFVGTVSALHAFAGLNMTDSLIASVNYLVERYSETDRTWLLFSTAKALALGAQNDQALSRLEELEAESFKAFYAHPATLDLFYFDGLRNNPSFRDLNSRW